MLVLRATTRVCTHRVLKTSETHLRHHHSTNTRRQESTDSSESNNEWWQWMRYREDGSPRSVRTGLMNGELNILVIHLFLGLTILSVCDIVDDPRDRA